MAISMTPRDFFFSFVMGNYEDYFADPGDIRRAFNVAIAASHMADHFYEYHRRSDPPRVAAFPHRQDYLDHVSVSTGGAFRHIRSIANAYKHLYPGPKSSDIDSAGRIESVAMESEVSEDDVAELGRDFTEPVIYFTTRTGERHQFARAIDVVISFWQRELYGRSEA